MKQAFYRVLFWLMLLAVGLWLLPIQQWFSFDESLGDNPMLDQARSSQVYPLTGVEQLTFNVNSARFPIRLLTNASLPLEALQEAQTANSAIKPMLSHQIQNGVNGLASSGGALNEVKWRYAIQLVLLDAKGDVLYEQVYHFRSGQKHHTYRLENRVLTGPLNFYPSEKLQVLDTRSVLLMPPKDVRALADRLQVTIHSTDDAISEVAIRSYEQLALTEKQVTYRWQRLSQKQKDRLVEDNIYPTTFVSAGEKQKLLAAKRQPMGPLGVLGEDYQQKKLYVGAETEQVPRLLAEYKVPDLGPEHVKAFYISEPDTPFTWQAWPGNSADNLRSDTGIEHGSSGQISQEQVEISARWFGNSTEQQTQILTAQPGQSSTNIFQPGLLILSSAQTLTFSTEIEENGPVQSAESLIRVYSVPSVLSAAEKATATDTNIETGPQNQALQYSLPRSKGLAAPIRIDLWSVNTYSDNALPDNTGLGLSRSGSVQMRVHDQQGEVIQRVELVLNHQANHFDYIKAEPEQRLSERNRFFYLLPAEGARVSFSASEPVLVSVSTRPIQMERISHVPGDYLIYQERNRIPTWFRIKPDNEPELASLQQILVTQSRYPDENIEQPSYWQSLLPVEQSTWQPVGRYLLMPRPYDQSIEPGNLASHFQELRVNQTYTLDLRHDYRRRFSPSLLLVSQAAKNATQGPMGRNKVRLWIDNRLVAEFAPLDNLETFRLPELTAGRYKIRLESRDSKLTAMISHSFPGNSFPGNSYPSNLSRDDLKAGNHKTSNLQLDSLSRDGLNSSDLNPNYGLKYWSKRWVSAVPFKSLAERSSVGNVLRFNYEKTTVEAESLLLQVFSRQEAYAVNRTEVKRLSEELAEKQRPEVSNSVTPSTNPDLMTAGRELPISVNISPITTSGRIKPQKDYALKSHVTTGDFQQPLTEWSHLKHTFYISGRSDSRGFDLASHFPDIVAGYPAYIRLGEDLPIGHYQIEISTQAKQPVYVQLLQKHMGEKVNESSYATEAER